MISRPGYILVVLPLLLLGACASGPTFETSQVDRSLTPAAVTAAPQYAKGKQVLWGGIILRVTNLANSTLIEMLAYPLDNRGKPQRDEAPLGRFRLEQSGFLEPAFYTKGKLLTVTGAVLRTETEKVGESQQTWPVVSAKELYAWPPDRFHDNSSLQFGGEIGVGHGF
jgi:outer membrane lipoprotein